MGRYHRKISRFFVRLVYYLGMKLRLPVIGRSPVHQTSLSTSSLHQFSGPNIDLFHLTVFQLPDELILSILSHVSPDPRPTSHHVWFRVRRGVDDCPQQMEFLRQLSMTCRAMRLRLLPWVWVRLVLPPPNTQGTGEQFMRKLDATASVLHANAFLAASVKCFYVLLYL